MLYPLVHERVWVSDRPDEYIVRSVDRAARSADVHLLADPTAIECGLPYTLLFAINDWEPDTAARFSWENWRVDHQDLIRSAQFTMHQSALLLSGLENRLFNTMEAIRVSRELIEASDALIARARNLGCNDLPG